MWISQAADQIKRLYDLFLKVDATQVEVNPLGETPEGQGNVLKCVSSCVFVFVFCLDLCLCVGSMCVSACVSLNVPELNIHNMATHREHFGTNLLFTGYSLHTTSSGLNAF